MISFSVLCISRKLQTSEEPKSWHNLKNQKFLSPHKSWSRAKELSHDPLNRKSIWSLCHQWKCMSLRVLQLQLGSLLHTFHYLWCRSHRKAAQHSFPEPIRLPGFIYGISLPFLPYPWAKPAYSAHQKIRSKCLRKKLQPLRHKG